MFNFLKRVSSPSKIKRHRPQKRTIQASTTDRLTEKWTAFPERADQIIRNHQRVLVARSREQSHNNDYAKAFIRLCTHNIVGHRGILLQAQSKDLDGKLDTKANDSIEAAWQNWGQKENCDITNSQSWRSIQNSAVISAAKDGEFMIRIITGRHAGPYGISLQLLDPVRCPSDYDEDKLRNGNFIRHGIEFTKYRKPVAYYFTTTDQSEGYYSIGGRNYVRIPANDIIHGFLPDIVGQKRGLPWMATALYRLKMLHGFEDAALVNARVNAAKMGFFEWEEGQGPQADEDDEIIMDVEPGKWFELPSGLHAKETNPNYPNGEFAIFSKSMLRGISAGLGVSYNNLANDLEGVNFSSIRQGVLDEREHWKELQEWLIESLMIPVFNAWLPVALLKGKIQVHGNPLKAERLEKYRQVSWQPRRWQWIDPLKDVNAAVISKDNLLTSPGQIIRDQGRDPDTVWREIARDIEQMKVAGIPEQFISQLVTKKAASLPNNKEEDNDKETSDN